MYTLHACMLSHFSCVWLFATQWTVACQAPLSMGFSRQEYWSGLPCPPPGDHPHLRIELVSAYVSCIASRFFTHWATGKAPVIVLSKANICLNQEMPYESTHVYLLRLKYTSQDSLASLCPPIQLLCDKWCPALNNFSPCRIRFKSLQD